jgi:anaerobic selenocysteine-containing dehydrogenase
MTPHFRTCTLCEAMCGIRIDVDGSDRITSIRGDDEDPFSRGYLCPKAVALRDLHEDPDRLKHPLRRVGDRWERMEWDEALELTASRLHAIQREHGNDAVATYAGNPTVHNVGAMIFAPMLFRTLRTRHGYSATSVDQLPHMLAAHLMFGHQLLLPIPDVDRTAHMLIIGANPLASNGSLMTAPGMKRRLRAIQERGGRVIVVDPRRTETAAIADEHIFVRPGTDALLLLAMLHTIFGEERARLGRLAPLVDGLEEVRTIAERFSPERVGSHTGVGAETIRRLAREHASAERAVVYARMGASTQAFGTLCQWLANVLNVVTGNLDREGGAMFTSPALDALRLPRGFGVGPGSFGRWRSRVRGLPEFGGELPVATLAEEIREEGEGRVRALLTVAGNPALSTPNGAELEHALARLDFMVSIDFYLNETTRHAHVILPPTGPLERGHYDVAFHLLAVRNTAKYSPPLFAPEHGARHDWQILLGLMTRLEALKQPGIGARARRLVRDGLLARLGPEGVIDLGLRLGPRRGMSLRKLRAAPHGIDLGALEPRFPERLFRDRITLAPRAIVEDVARLEATIEAPPAALAVLGPEGELALIGRRHLRSNNSWMHNAAGLMSGRERCTLMMHPDDARARAIESGATVRVTSRVGSVTVPVEITSDVMRGVVSLPHGFGHAREGVRLRVATEHAGASINDLTDDQAIDALSGNAAFSGVPVRVEAAPPTSRR